jgi:hypothetical protein
MNGCMLSCSVPPTPAPVVWRQGAGMSGVTRRRQYGHAIRTACSPIGKGKRSSSWRGAPDRVGATPQLGRRVLQLVGL